MVRVGWTVISGPRRREKQHSCHSKYHRRYSRRFRRGYHHAGRLPATGVKPGRDVSDEERLKMLRDLLSYLVPRLSAVQVTGNNGGPVTVAELDIAKIMQDPELADAEQR